MVRRLIGTDSDTATTILRLVLGVASSRTAPKRAGLVRRLRFQRDYGLLHRRNAHSSAIRVPGPRRRILWRPGPHLRIPDADRGVRHFFQHDRGRRNGPSQSASASL
jgi:hypothetical protein